MGSLSYTCGEYVNTLFIQGTATCDKLSTYFKQLAIASQLVCTTRRFYSTIHHTDAQFYPQRFSLQSICYDDTYAHYPQRLLLQQRSYLKER